MAAAKKNQVEQTITAQNGSDSVSGINVPVQQFGRKHKTDSDMVAVEEPLEIRLSWPVEGGTEERQIAITMRTPGNDDDLAAGFLFTEGIICSHEQVSGVASAADSHDQARANVVVVHSREAVSLDALALERNFYITSSCGVCGKASIEALRTRSKYPVGADIFQVPADVVAGLPDQLIAAQEIFAGTGGIHAAGLFDSRAVVGQVFEDVGRHNAVDKLIGSRLRAGDLPLSDFGLLVSGRASFELVQKASMAGCPMLAAVGAPSSLAIELAWESNMTLVGFLRDSRFNVYAGKSRIG